MSIDPAAATTPTVTVTAPGPTPLKAFDEDDGPSFSDVLDIINPLQHIPIINTIYQHLTGDTEGALADVAGGTLWAGPIGLVTSLIDLAVKSETGKSISDNILGWLGLEDDSDTAVAAAAPAQQQQAQQQQQQAAAIEAPPAVTVQALAPLPAKARGDERKEADRKGDKDGPPRIGDYMVFGAAGSGQPLALTPAQPVMAADEDRSDAANGPRRQGNYLVFGGQGQQRQQAAARPGAPALGSSVAPAAAVVASAVSASPSAPVSRQGAYMVFGGQQMTPASASVTANAPLPQVASAKTDAVANSVPSGGGPAQLSPMPTRSFAAPARRSQVTPTGLPMPTTGPAAIPGHIASSQAVASASSDDSWFVQAVNSGLDKYAAAQRLAGQDNLAASAAAGAQATTLH